MSSSVIRSSWDTRGEYICFVTQALDKQQVSVVPATSQTKRPLSIHFTIPEARVTVTALQWCTLPNVGSQCVVAALSSGEIWIYAPLANEIIAKLSTGRSHAINGMDISGSRFLFAVDANDHIYEFDLEDYKFKRERHIEGCKGLVQLSIVDGSDRLLLASHTIFLVDFEAGQILRKYPGHVSPIHLLVLLNETYFVSGAHNDRFLNIYNIEDGSTKGVLVAESNVLTIANSGSDSVAVTTEDGKLEMFINPLGDTTKRRRNIKSKTFSKQIFASTNDGRPVALINAFISADSLRVLYLQNATQPCFKQIMWDTMPTLYNILIDDRLAKSSSSKESSLYGSDAAASIGYKEGNASVTSGDNFKHLDVAIEMWAKELDQQRQEHERLDEENNEDSMIESLEDKLKGSNLSHSKQNRHNGKRNINSVSSAGTVTVILSQALQANDRSLLETVLNNRDERIIRDTIYKLPAMLAVILLERLAERIARQSHRQGQLNVWVKWCLIIHGGYLISIPNLVSSLASLKSTLRRRAELLPHLLALETRIDYTLDHTKLQGLDTTVTEDHTQDVQEENLVDYNEELDDAGLIDDGEEDESDSMDDNDSQSSNESDDNSLPDASNSDDPEQEDEGVSDVET